MDCITNVYYGLTDWAAEWITWQDVLTVLFIGFGVVDLASKVSIIPEYINLDGGYLDGDELTDEEIEELMK